MTRALTLFLALSTATAAHAGVDACFTGTGGEALQGLRVTYSPDLFTHYELETDSAGCVDVPTRWSWQTTATIDIHATNRVVMMVNGGFEVIDHRSVSDGDEITLSADHTVAEQLRVAYEDGMRGFGPFTGTSPLGGTLASGPYISADLDSFMVVDLPYVEPLPLPAPFMPPRLHLRASESSSTLSHELSHALMFSQWSALALADVETYYIGWLLGPNNTHSWSSPSTDHVAFLEAFGGVGSVFDDVGNNESAFFAEADDRVDTLREDRSGDDTIEGVVFGILYHEFAMSKSLDYVVQTVIDCEVLTLDEYASCIADLEGHDSSTFGALRQAAWTYGVEFTDAPTLWDWDFCGDGFSCAAREGDCDSNSDCAAGLVCAHDVGTSYGRSWSLDVCEPPNGDADLCTPEYPCSTGEGDCDTNADCGGSLSICAHNVGANYGLASWVDVCEINWAVPTRR